MNVTVSWRMWSAAAAFPEATSISDLFHAREHRHGLTRAPEVRAAGPQG
jgi:hypothetical protein